MFFIPLCGRSHDKVMCMRMPRFLNKLIKEAAQKCKFCLRQAGTELQPKLDAGYSTQRHRACWSEGQGCHHTQPFLKIKPNLLNFHQQFTAEGPETRAQHSAGRHMSWISAPCCIPWSLTCPACLCLLLCSSSAGPAQEGSEADTTEHLQSSASSAHFWEKS